MGTLSVSVCRNHECVPDLCQLSGFLLKPAAEICFCGSLVQQCLGGRLLVLACFDGLRALPGVPEFFQRLASHVERVLQELVAGYFQQFVQNCIARLEFP